MNNISTADEFRQKIEANRYGFFTFPQLDVTIKYRMPDLLKLSLNNQLPSFLAEQVIAGYKSFVNGTTQDFLDELKTQHVDVSDDLVKELATKGYKLLTELCVSHKIMDVPESDFDVQPIPLVAWSDIPENDSIAFTTHLMVANQTVKTKDGGEMSTTDIADFPDGQRVKKRRTVRKDG